MRPEIDSRLFRPIFVGEVLEAVHQFHVTMPCPSVPPRTREIPKELLELRSKLVVEECNELSEAVMGQNLEKVIDGLCDWAYVTYGAYDTLGFSHFLTPYVHNRVSPHWWVHQTPNRNFDLVNQDPLCPETQEHFHRIYSWTKAFQQAMTLPSYEDMWARLKELSVSLTPILSHSCEQGRIPLAGFFREVHAANMDKLGGPVRPEDGKQLKPEGWIEPRIGEVLQFVRKWEAPANAQ